VEHLIEGIAIGIAVLGLGASLSYARVCYVDRLVARRQALPPVIGQMAYEYWLTAVGLAVINGLMVIVAINRLGHVVLQSEASLRAIFPDMAAHLGISLFTILKWHLRHRILLQRHDEILPTDS
jgi:hypothetical protein